MRDLYELVCSKCGNRIFEFEFIERCKRVSSDFLDKKSICNGKNKIKSIGVCS